LRFSSSGEIVVEDYMKKRVTLMVLVFAFTICCNSNGIAGTKKIMAHYMPWYQSQPFRGYWGWHWTMNHFSPPTTYASHYQSLFGLYDSSDPHVLASQALLMKFAGIDGIIADWYGIECFYDYCLIKDSTNLFIPYIKEAGLEFSVCYEDNTVKIMLDAGHFPNRATAVAHGEEVMMWLQTNYFTDSSYLKIDDRPVLLCFGPQFFTSAEWGTLFGDLSPKPHFFPLKYSTFVSYPPKTGEFDWPNPNGGSTPASPTPSTDIISDATNFYSRASTYHWEHFIAGAYPRFHDIYAEAGVHSSYGYIDDQYPAFGTTYSYTLERALQSDANIVQLVTWNDYGEGTIIEPTVEDGYLYLEMTQQLRKEYIDSNFPYVAADLRLPVRLYMLRKENLSNPTVMAQLATVEDYLFANNLSGAEKLLDQIECTGSIAGDFDDDCKVNLDDLAVLILAWLSKPGDDNWNSDCDIFLPPDNVINFLDFAVLAENWLTSAP
jgi:hypothetical protein